MRSGTSISELCKPNLTHTSPADGEQLGEEVTPRRNDLPDDDRAILEEDGAPRDGGDALGVQAGIGDLGIGIGQAGDVGRLVDSVKYLQVRKRLLLTSCETLLCRRNSRPREPWWQGKSWTPPSSTWHTTSRRPTTGRSRGTPPWTSTSSPPSRASGGKEPNRRRMNSDELAETKPS